MDYHVKNKDENLIHGDLTYKLIGLMYEVHNQYGSGNKENVYQNALAEKFEMNKLDYEKEKSIPIKSEDTDKELGRHRLDFVIEDKVILELKSIKYVPKKIQNQLYTYLKNTNYKVGLLINFGGDNLYFKRIIYTN